MSNVYVEKLFSFLTYQLSHSGMDKDTSSSS